MTAENALYVMVDGKRHVMKLII